ncbi:MAG: UDP-N-acetylmuramate--alanine ligase [Patescibacteria group bacterium]|nr:UDP-N-acetylmuramate--alanine ligase [Patescibacteria group bacterium]
MNVYFSGIGGVGIGPLAEIAHDAGYNVIGSDLVESLVTKELHKKGILISKIQDGSFLKECHQKNPIDWFIYTAALNDNHPELMMARELGIKTAKRDELLAYIIEQKKLKLIAVSGTHGKTTTTGILVWILQQINIPISYSIGTTLTFGPSGKFNPDSEYFIYECDEFDRNFLHFKPYLSLLTSIDYDHSDTYKTPEDYLEAFKQFAINSNQVITWDDQHSTIFNGMNQVTILNHLNIDTNLSIAGDHNRRNATLVQAALDYLKIDKKVSDLIINFPGTDRRFEKLDDNLYSDYGHHPTEIAATLQLAHEISDHVVLVYQPHQNIRQHELRNQYTNQFELAEEIYWLPTYLSREDPNLPILKPQDLIQNITNKENIHVAKFNDDLWNTIKKLRQEKKLVLCMGAGEIDNWVREKLAKD